MNWIAFLVGACLGVVVSWMFKELGAPLPVQFAGAIVAGVLLGVVISAGAPR